MFRLGHRRATKLTEMSLIKLTVFFLALRPLCLRGEFSLWLMSL